MFRNFSAEPVVSRGLVGGDDDISTLSDSEQKPVCLVAVDGHQICCGNCEWMTIKRDPDHVVDRGVDQAKHVLFAFRKLDLAVLAASRGVHVGSIDKDCVRRRWSNS